MVPKLYPLGPSRRDSDSQVHMGTEMWMSNKLPGDAEAHGPGLHFENHSCTAVADSGGLFISLVVGEKGTGKVRS